MEVSRPWEGEGRQRKGGSERPGIPNPVGEELVRPSGGPDWEGPSGAADAGPGKPLGTEGRELEIQSPTTKRK